MTRTGLAALVFCKSGESPADVTPAAKTTTVEAKKMYAWCAGLGSAFSRSPEQTWQDPPGFYGNENYGFEWERWAQEQERKRLAETKHLMYALFYGLIRVNTFIVNNTHTRTQIIAVIKYNKK